MEQRINALTATRGFAAFMVVIFHFGTEVFPFNKFEQFFTGGNLGVSYFFVLSGFVMYITYQNRSISYGEFMKRRIARIAPLYYFAILFTAALPIYWFTRYSIPLETDFVKKMLANFLFLQAYIPGYALTMNAPGWSLSVEMFFYLMFPLLLLFSKKNSKRFLWFAVIFYILSQGWHLWMLKYYGGTSPEMHELIYYNPVGHLNGFVAGIAGGMLYTHRQDNIKISSLLLAVIIIVLLTWRPVSLHNGMLAPVFILFIIAVTAKQPAFLKWQPLVFLGEISYGIYLLQEPVHKYFIIANKLLFHLGFGEVFFYAYVAVLVLAATITYYAIEKPLRKWINAL